MWHFKSSAQMVSDFKSTRSPQGNEEFVRNCRLPAGKSTTVVALGVRATIAELGQVEPDFIRADDQFDNELISLPFWDSLDTYEVILTLQEHLGIDISDNDAQQIRHPEMSRGMTVADFASDVFNVLADKIDA